MFPQLLRASSAVLVVFVSLAPRAAAAATVVPPGNIATATWTLADSPYLLTGDVSVGTGATLTIQAGTVVQFAAGDASGGGLSATQTELMVDGALLVQGSWSTPVTFEAESGTSPGTWFGIVTDDGAVVSIEGAVIAEAEYGIYGYTDSGLGGLLAVSQTLVQDSTIGMFVRDALIAEVRVTGMVSIGIAMTGSGSIMNTIVDHCAGGISNANALLYTALTIENCTIDSNSFTGVLAGATSTFPLSLVNDLITNNGAYGIHASVATSVSSSYSDVWNNGMGDYSGLSAGTASFSADPLYVGAADYHLRAGSPAIDTGTDVGAPGQDFDLHPRPQDGDGMNGAQFDLGAYEYAPTGGVDAGTSAGAAGGGAAGASGQGGNGGAAGGGAAGASGQGGKGGAGPAGSSGAAGIGGGVAGGGGGGMAGAGAAGKSGAPGSAGTTGRAGADGQPSGGASSGCGCQMGGPGPGSLSLVLAAAAASLLAVRRRRRFAKTRA